VAGQFVTVGAAALGTKFTSVSGYGARMGTVDLKVVAAATSTAHLDADAYTDWLTNITAGWGPFARFSTLAGTVVGVVMLGALIYAVLNIVLGVAKGGYRRNGRSDAIADGREQLQHGIIALVVIPVVPVIAAAIYLLAKNS
jgi:hypothetical protein